ncbi:MAG TPA: histidine kinase [Melioribacteraceae bacterium]|nr:histidine kinase [Melioribacteraceae bacterium]
MNTKVLFGLLKRKRIYLHILFWIGYLSYYTFQSGYYNNDYLEMFKGYLIYLPILLAATYFTNYYVVPKFLLTKQYFKFVIIFIISAIIFILSMKSVFWLYLAPKYYNKMGLVGYYKAGFFYPTYLMAHAISIYFIVFVFGFIKLTKRWFINNQITQELKKEKLEAELKFLKAQMNPHFLFNVLNSLYALALKQSDKTADMILKLSAMMDYILYESKNDFILIEKELKLIYDYVELEKLRYGEKLNFNFIISGKTDNVYLPPLILFPFIENSFKHGVSNSVDHSYINVTLNLLESKIEFIIENNKPKYIINHQKKEGIGLNNVLKRLELIYQNKYTFEKSETENTFLIKLNIKKS